MDQRRSLAAILIFIGGVAAAWFLLAEGLISFIGGDTSRSQEGAPDTSEPLRIEHMVAGGMHTYTGSLELPTPCHTLSASLTANGTRHARISLSTEEPPEGTACAQVIDAQAFALSLSSEQSPVIVVELNGVEVPISIVER